MYCNLIDKEIESPDRTAYDVKQERLKNLKRIQKEYLNTDAYREIMNLPLR